MAGALIEATFDVEQALGALGRLEAAARGSAPFMRAIGTGLVRTTQDRLGGTKDPWGNQWQPLNPLYAMDKTKPGMLREMGDAGGLSSSITYEAGAGWVRVGSNKIYAGVHQFGATIKPVRAAALRFTMGGLLFIRQQVIIPERPYLGIGTLEPLMIDEAFRDVMGAALRP